jgi:hypothetical protein
VHIIKGIDIFVPNESAKAKIHSSVYTFSRKKSAEYLHEPG